MCCDSWDRKESDTTEQLNGTELMIFVYAYYAHSGQFMSCLVYFT